MVDIVAIRESDRSELNFLALRIIGVGLEVDPRLEAWIAAKQVIRRSVLLNNDDDMFEGRGRFSQSCEAERQSTAAQQ